MSAQPTLPPPNYTDSPQPAAAYKGAKPNKSYGTTDGANEPLLNDAAGSSRAWMDQAAEDDLPDDFKWVHALRNIVYANKQDRSQCRRLRS
jgi:hypothetical protein